MCGSSYAGELSCSHATPCPLALVGLGGGAYRGGDGMGRHLGGGGCGRLGHRGLAPRAAAKKCSGSRWFAGALRPQSLYAGLVTAPKPRAINVIPNGRHMAWSFYKLFPRPLKGGAVPCK